MLYGGPHCDAQQRIAFALTAGSCRLLLSCHHQNMTTLSKMLLVYDGTAESQAALSRCKQLSLALKAHVDVVSVVDPDSANATCAGMHERACLCPS